MKMLLTGASGFVGKEILNKVSAYMEIITLGRQQGAQICCDLSMQIPLIPSIDIVVHAAGKAHMVPKNTTEKEDFFKVNVQGTQNLLFGLAGNKALTTFVFLSSVAVYGLTEGKLINEQTPLLATDSYGQSKIAAEKLVADWCMINNVRYYILRLPLIAGKNAPGNLGAMVKGITKGIYFSIGTATAKKSIVLDSDLARLLLSINGPSGIYNLTDGNHPSFAALENHIAAFYKMKKTFAIPTILASLLALAGDVIGRRAPINSEKLNKIKCSLTFDDSKARTLLQWQSTPVLSSWEPN